METGNNDTDSLLLQYDQLCFNMDANDYWLQDMEDILDLTSPCIIKSLIYIPAIIDGVKYIVFPTPAPNETIDGPRHIPAQPHPIPNNELPKSNLKSIFILFGAFP